METVRLKGDSKGVALIFAGGVIWGTIGPLVRVMDGLGASAELTSFLRVSFAFLILIVLTVLRGGLKALRVDRKTIVVCAALGILCQGLYNVAYCWSVNLAGVGTSVALTNIAPVFTALACLVIFGERLPGGKVLVLALNVGGCVMASTGLRFDVSMLPVVGLACGIVAGFCYAMTAVIGRLAANRCDPFVVSTYSYLFAALFLIPVTRPWDQPAVHDPSVLAIGFFLALVPTALAYLLYYRGLQLVSNVASVPVIASVEIVVAVVLGIAFFGEEANVVALAGVAVILASEALLGMRIASMGLWDVARCVRARLSIAFSAVR